MNDLYRPCVGIVLKNKDGFIFLGRRYSDLLTPYAPPSWQMPQGGIDEGETPENAALRELFEEVGTHKAKILKQSSTWHSYDLPKHIQKKLWGGQYKGQTQKWFLMEFLGIDDDIHIQTEHPEFCEWMWATPKECLDCAVDFKKNIYEEVFKELLEF